jgi:hypothetical protein
LFKIIGALKYSVDFCIQWKLWINIMNDSNVIQGRKEEIRVLCEMFPALPMRQYSIIESGCRSAGAKTKATTDIFKKEV